MKKTGIFLAAGLMLASAVATAQTPVRVRGTITGLDGDVLSVKTRQGQDVKINLAPNFGVAAAGRHLADFGPGTMSVDSQEERRRTAGRQRVTGCLRHRGAPWDTAPGIR
jgi:hypothetical protein